MSIRSNTGAAKNVLDLVARILLYRTGLTGKIKCMSVESANFRIFINAPTSAGKMRGRIRLLPIPLVKLIVFLSNTQPALCANQSSSATAPPIGFPATQYWYVALRAGGLLQ